MKRVQGDEAGSPTALRGEDGTWNPTARPPVRRGKKRYHGNRLTLSGTPDELRMDLDGLGACTTLGRREQTWSEAPSAWRDISANDVPTGSDAVAPSAGMPNPLDILGAAIGIVSHVKRPQAEGGKEGSAPVDGVVPPPHLRPPATCRPPRRTPRPSPLPPPRWRQRRLPRRRKPSWQPWTWGHVGRASRRRRRWSRRTRLPSRPRRPRPPPPPPAPPPAHAATALAVRVSRRSIVPARRAALPRCYAIESCRARDAVG